MTDMPPLPEPAMNDVHPLMNVFAFGYHADQMRSYASTYAKACLEEVLLQFSRELEYPVNSPCAGAYQEQGKQAIKVVRRMLEELK